MRLFVVRIEKDLEPSATGDVTSTGTAAAAAAAAAAAEMPTSDTCLELTPAPTKGDHQEQSLLKMHHLLQLQHLHQKGGRQREKELYLNLDTGKEVIWKRAMGQLRV